MEEEESREFFKHDISNDEEECYGENTTVHMENKTNQLQQENSVEQQKKSWAEVVESEPFNDKHQKTSCTCSDASVNLGNNQPNNSSNKINSKEKNNNTFRKVSKLSFSTESNLNGQKMIDMLLSLQAEMDGQNVIDKMEKFIQIGEMLGYDMRECTETKDQLASRIERIEVNQ
ncbi:hypothetical protein L2E82_08953 [Cichorium intybus]|uniref:Uncharacterized protein n=1 Tax=Cichorium intybus TaxID=13427 RepID=A0ACB9G708_CICIN|nr:hypothetical protein L2E82_08953 [Cichorium intybus]